MPNQANLFSSPPLPLPEPLRGAETGTFAHHTVTRRLPEIGRRVLVENIFSPEVNHRLESWLDEMPEGPLRPLQDREAPDWNDWQGYIVPYAGQNWLEAPWFFVETYFYRRILEATGYFQKGSGKGVDPYALQKRQGLEGSLKAIHAAVEALAALRQAGCAALPSLFQINLWGNQADLSMWPAGQALQPEALPGGSHLLCDDSAHVADYLSRPGIGPARIDLILDNTGLELVHDLLLADCLLSSGVAGNVVFHLKAHPTFVSDATRQDVHATLAFLSASGDRQIEGLAARLNEFLRRGELILQDHFFWTSPLGLWEAPFDLQQELARSALIISKGDANYRRLLDDRHWLQTVPFGDVLSYLPVSVLALRVCKSEVIVGLRPGQAEEASRLDARWMIDGRWGVIQFAENVR